MKSLLLPAAVLALATPALAAPPVKVTEAWCRPTMPGAPSAGCYLTLTAAQADSLKSVATPAAERVEVHSMSMTGDVMKMQKLDKLDLPGGQAIALQPGGMHLMLIRPKAALAAAGQVPLTLTFAKAPAATVKAEVRNPAPAPMSMPMEHHHH